MVKKEENDLFSTWIGQEVMGLNCTYGVSNWRQQRSVLSEGKWSTGRDAWGGYKVSSLKIFA